MQATGRTGCRPPRRHLKAWASSHETLTERLRVAVVDEDLPVGTEGGRKSWYLALTQPRDLADTLGPVHGLPAMGHTTLLFEDDVIALVEYLLGGLVLLTDDGRVLNEAADAYARAVSMRRKAAGSTARGPRDGAR
jgi:hypothetical protein